MYIGVVQLGGDVAFKPVVGNYNQIMAIQK